MYRAARRLPPDVRREQLLAIAVELAARDGYSGFSLDELTERAGVTRNLVYRYFPRGRIDLYLAVVERAGEEITRGWITDRERPVAERMDANFERMAAHASGPSDEWVIHRQIQTSDEPEIIAVGERYLNRIIDVIALNQLGTDDPPPLARIAIASYLAFTETALDRARRAGIPLEELRPLITQTLVAAMSAGPATESSPNRAAEGRA